MQSSRSTLGRWSCWLAVASLPLGVVACSSDGASSSEPVSDVGDPAGDAPTAEDTAEVDEADGQGGDVREDAPGDGSEVEAEAGDAPSARVEATVELRTPFGAGLADAEVRHDERTTTTDGQGTATVEVPASAPFEIVASKEGYWDHRLVGRAGTEPFSYVSFAASAATTSQVFGGVGVTVDEAAGILVVGVDDPQLQPVVGARVELDATHDQPITLSSSGADADNEIEQGERGFVSFPNVAPGEVEVQLQPPEGMSCSIHPGGGPRPPIDVEAGTVTVVTFTCA